MFVWNTLLAFYDESEEYHVMKTRGSESRELQEYYRNENSYQARAYRDALKDAHRACSACCKTPELAGVNKLRRCTRCMDIGRNVYYCSKECQRKDWKSGRPPHKTICGNPTALADIVTGTSPLPAETPDSDDSRRRPSPETRPTHSILDYFRIAYSDPPNPDYTRSPALLHQLKLLKKDSLVDYFLITPWPDPDYGITLSNLVDRVVFKTNLAMGIAQHSPTAVQVMYKLLSPIAETFPNVGKEGLEQQLKREYGIDMELEPTMSDLELSMSRQAIGGLINDLVGEEVDILTSDLVSPIS
ncbi:hypothetical protein VKT23_007612 [Stygiomarasmius scandens]|uniref:MYND-type domain-containing protein n=1 Tax=Marasmiellus scandens TaxID=2682957 RepID=A0ABR1JKC2_9AGAR